MSPQRAAGAKMAMQPKTRKWHRNFIKCGRKTNVIALESELYRELCKGLRLAQHRWWSQIPFPAIGATVVGSSTCARGQNRIYVENP